jgi:hypothetical protein
VVAVLDHGLDHGFGLDSPLNVRLTGEVARIHEEEVTLSSETIQIAGPPGQPALLGGVSAAGFYLAHHIAGVHDREIGLPQCGVAIPRPEQRDAKDRAD